jgi:arylsulfatase A-like enzyme
MQAAGSVVHDLVSLVDLGPTVLELCGVAVPRWMEGRSLAPYLAGGRAPPRDVVFSEHAGDRILSGTTFMTMARSASWKLVHFADSDEGQLFDLERDPREVTNQWHSPHARAIKEQLLDRILAWRIESSLVTQHWVRDAWRLDS